MSQLAREARIPNPRLAAFEPFIGVWTTVGHHSMIANTTLHGRTSIEWHEGGGFVCIRSEIDEPKVPSAIAIIGTDDDAESLTMSYFDERPVSRHYEARIDGRVLQWSRMSPGFSQRFVITLDADGNTMRAVSTLSKDNATWEQDMELTYTRVR